MVDKTSPAGALRIRTRTTVPGENPRSLRDRIYGLFAMAKVLKIDDSGDQRIVRVQARNFQPEDVPVYEPAGLRHKIAGEVLLVRFGGSRRNTMALAHDVGKKGDDYLQDGDVAVDDYRGLRVWLAADGIHIAANGLPVVVENAEKFRVEGDIEATGEIYAMADGARIPLSTHKTSGVKAGTDESGPPVAP